jgi:hypothetical protein
LTAKREDLTMALDPDTTYIRSSFLHALQEDGNVVIWHSLFGHPTVVPTKTFEFLESFSTSKTLASLFEDKPNDEDSAVI